MDKNIIIHYDQANQSLDERVHFLNDKFDKQLDIFEASLKIFFQRIEAFDSILSEQHKCLNQDNTLV